MIFFNCCKASTDMSNLATEQITIIEAVKNKQLEVVSAALKKGADVNTKAKNSKSLLLIATQLNDLEMAKLLVSYKADVNQQDDIHDSPFLYAGASGNVALLKLFLANGARFDIFNRYNGTALIPACERGHVEAVRLLGNIKGFPINHVNRLGWTGLMEAVVLGNGSSKYVEIVQNLVEAGCDTSIPDKNGVTALQHAISMGFSGTANVLRNKG
ncbi:hypothetical protein SAMN04488524_0640 [Pedobacter africanus]|uniref:Uncharacterized protein n=2 Tax=Pedobacter africanus TaxID=151894 RepID=A0A1W1ZDX7_9SPHI|nr:hypothetical protein SAMN04488524_0640 [Pedobacter africanus]